MNGLKMVVMRVLNIGLASRWQHVSMSVKVIVGVKLKAISYREDLVLDDQSASPVRVCA
jgi:hypothetical protein